MIVYTLKHTHTHRRQNKLLHTDLQYTEKLYSHKYNNHLTTADRTEVYNCTADRTEVYITAPHRIQYYKTVKDIYHIHQKLAEIMTRYKNIQPTEEIIIQIIQKKPQKNITKQKKELE